MYREKNQDEKYVLEGENRKSPAFVEYHIIALVNVIERNVRDAILGFVKLREMIESCLPQVCLEILSIYINLRTERKESVT